MIRSVSLLILAVASAALLLPACDNPACVFGGTCIGSTISGALGTEPASIPAEGEQILAAAPTITGFFPTGTTVEIESPIVILFSESMSGDNINIAFEILVTNLGGAVPLQAATLVGDGHMAVLFPLTPLQPSQEYSVRFRENVQLFDRTGQAVVQPANRVIGTFTTGESIPENPSVVAIWPPNGATNQSPTTEIDVVFSRSIETSTVTDASWIVTVGGTAPDPDPVAQPISILGLTETRLFRWRSVDATGEFVPLGTNASVRFEISPVGARIEDPLFGVVPNTIVTFTTLPFEAPVSAAITSEPSDAIGIAQISGPADLAIQVELSGAQAGDRIGVYVFGKEPQTTNPPQPVANLRTIALQREVDVEAPFTTFTWTAAELDLLQTSAPLKARFADSTLAFAFYLKRGTAVSPVKLLDVDASANGTQSPVLDTVAPVLLGLSTSGNVTNSFRSSVRDMVLVGRASESLRAALVETPTTDNVVRPGELPMVTGSHASGLFIAAPVRVGVLPAGTPPIPYTLTVYDRALNTATPVAGRFVQVGQAANGPRVGFFTNVTVEVVDGTTRAPVVGAIVHVHENLGGFTSVVDSGVTGPQGRVVLAPALLGETIVTVDATALGYDLFTFDGIPTDTTSIPLRPTSQTGALVSGAISTLDPSFTTYTKGVADTRFPTPGETLVATGSCALNPQAQAFLCNFGPSSIRARELGAQSAVVVRDPVNPLLYSPLTFLKGFSLSLPMPPVDPTMTQTNTLVMGTSLDAGTLDPEELPVDVTPSVLSTVNWPTIMGNPRVRVEATSPGLPRNVTVGRGIAFNTGLPANTWAVRAAYPGSVDGIADMASDELGRYVKSQTVEPDLLLRAEVVDALGNRGGVRPRLSMLMTSHTPPAAPVPDRLLAFSDNGPTVDLAFPDVLPDAVSQPGIYRVVLTDAAGFSWTVWRLDAPDVSGPDAVVHLPRIGPGGTLPLLAGDLAVRVSAFAWPTLDPALFMWSDVEREFDLFSHAATVTLTPP